MEVFAYPNSDSFSESDVDSVSFDMEVNHMLEDPGRDDGDEGKNNNK